MRPRQGVQALLKLVFFKNQSTRACADVINSLGLQAGELSRAQRNALKVCSAARKLGACLFFLKDPCTYIFMSGCGLILRYFILILNQDHDRFHQSCDSMSASCSVLEFGQCAVFYWGDL